MRFATLRLLMPLVLTVCLPGFLGCAGRLKTMVADSFVRDIAAATGKHDDVALVSQAVPTFLLLLEGLLEGNPDDPNLLRAAAEFYTSYGVLVELEDRDRARQLYRRAKTYGLRALAQDRNIRPLLHAPYADFVHIREHLEPRDVSLVFWAGSSWGAWIAASTASMEALADLPKVILLMEWVLENDESFHGGSPHVFLGMYHASLPPALGGNPKKAREHFDRALEISQNQDLMVHVQMARYYARQVFDRELYESLLRQVLALPADQVPGLTLQNMAARQMALKLLQETDEIF